MSKPRLTLFAAVVLLLAGVAFVQAGTQDFTLVNDTGLAIHELYLSPAKSDNWGEDILGVDVLADGKQADISFSPHAKSAVWDLKIVDEDGDEVEWQGLRLTEIEKITLHNEDGKPTADLE